MKNKYILHCFFSQMMLTWPIKLSEQKKKKILTPSVLIRTQGKHYINDSPQS